MNDHLSRFVDEMDELVGCTTDPRGLADGTASRLPGLLAHPEFLEERFRLPDPNRYRQHVVHVHPEGAYSIVSLVWRPGQETPIHDHRCWCVVGVLQGMETETRYELHQGPSDRFLVPVAESHYLPGQVCALVPPDEDIHKVANGDRDGDKLTISMHIYGANIAEVGTSINHTFDHAVVRDVDPGSRPVAWRSSI